MINIDNFITFWIYYRWEILEVRTISGKQLLDLTCRPRMKDTVFSTRREPHARKMLMVARELETPPSGANMGMYDMRRITASKTL